MPAALIRSRSLFERVEYAYAASAPAGTRLVFFAGSCPLDEAGNTVGVGDYRRQAEQCVTNLRIAMGEVACEVCDLVSTRVLVASTKREDLGAVWEVVRDALAPHDPPSTLMGVTVLGYEDQLVEVEAVAAIRN